jgi:hypothetical protein
MDVNDDQAFTGVYLLTAAGASFCPSLPPAGTT